MRFNLLGCGFLFLFMAVLAPFTLLRHFVAGGDFYGYVVGCVVAGLLVSGLDLRLRARTRSQEEIDSSDADWLIDYRRGGMLGCLPVWVVVWAFPFLLYSEYVKGSPTAPPVAAVTSSLPRAVAGENYNLSLAKESLKKKDYNGALTWVELALTEALTPDQRLSALLLRATAHESLKRFQEACKDYKEYLKLAPSDAKVKDKLKRCQAKAKKK